MIIRSRCPNCNEVTYDTDAGQCTNCGIRGIVNATPVLDQVALDGFLQNVRLFMADLGDTSFQQILGPFSPRVGRGPEDGVVFTEETAAMTCRYFRQQGVLCLWLALTANYHTEHSLMVANSENGLDRGLRIAKKAASKMRARLEIKPPPSDA